MEYTKDVILNVNYGQGEKARGRIWRLFYKISSAMGRHKIMTTVVSMTLMLIILDMMLVASFVQVLNSLSM